jgi:hypothetical protein
MVALTNATISTITAIVHGIMATTKGIIHTDLLLLLLSLNMSLDSEKL